MLEKQQFQNKCCFGGNMVKKKENRKIQYTKRVIKESFLELVKAKDFRQITVKEITELADINRATFYAHYENCEALTREIEVEMAQEVINALDKLYSSANYETEVVTALFDAIANKQEMCMWMLDDHVTGYGNKLIYEYARNTCLQRWKEQGNLNDTQAEAFLIYIYSGAMGYLKNWYQQGFAGGVEKHRRQFEDMVHCTLRYIYDK